MWLLGIYKVIRSITELTESLEQIQLGSPLQVNNV